MSEVILDKVVDEGVGSDRFAQIALGFERQGYVIEDERDMRLLSMREFAIARALFYSAGIGDRPPVIFPNGECYQHMPFSREYVSRYRQSDQESAHFRIEFMLGEHGTERGFPVEFSEVLGKRGGESALCWWQENREQIEQIASGVYNRLAAGYEASAFQNGDGILLSEPQSYEVSAESLQLEGELWDDVHSELADLLAGSVDISEIQPSVIALIQVFNSIKDPITPMNCLAGNQAQCFIDLFLEVSQQISFRDLDAHQKKILITQLASEAAYLTLPVVIEDARTKVAGRHQLIYSEFEDFSRMPRGEATDPGRVLVVLDDILNESIRNNRPMITPPAIGFFESDEEIVPFIIDGNNRATAIEWVKRLVASDFSTDDQSFERYCVENRLPEWWIAELMKLEIEAKFQGKVEFNRQQKEMMRRIANAKSYPGLITLEADYHTVWVKRTEEEGKFKLIAPFMQKVAHKFIAMFAEKSQTHGRAEWNGEAVPLAED